MTQKQYEKLKKLEESYSFLQGVEEATRSSMPLNWRDMGNQYEILTWCSTRKLAIESEGDIMVSKINGEIFASHEDYVQ